MENAQIISDERSLPFFHSVSIRAFANVKIKTGDEQKIFIKAKNADVSNIKTKVKKKELVITFKNVFRVVSHPVFDIEITFTEFRAITLKGAGKVFSDEVLKAKELDVISNGVGNIILKVETEKLNTELKGVGMVELIGKTDFQKVILNGTGLVDNLELESKKADVTLNGVGECRVQVSEELIANMKSIGKIKYKGTPEIRGNISGLGGLEKIG